MDQKKISVIVLLDISKAFDSILHDLMIRKLRKAGLSESACAWFESYLSQRQQVVKFQNTVSYPLPLTVPQGSIVGPVLFTLYGNDLFRVPKHCEPLVYVDDTKPFLVFPAGELNDVISAVNETLKEISIWCCRNSLLINPDITKLLHVGVPQLMRTYYTYIHTYFIGSSPRGFSESILHYKIINQVHDNKNKTMIKEDKGQ